MGSYANMERGFYRISLDNLFLILGVFDADIREVWPAESAGTEAYDQRIYRRRIQQFRLGEIVSLSSAEGAALFRIRNSRCRLLLEQNLSDFLLDRLHFYLEEKRNFSGGIWLRKESGESEYALFLKADRCPPYVKKLANDYLSIWANLFETSSFLNCCNRYESFDTS